MNTIRRHLRCSSFRLDFFTIYKSLAAEKKKQRNKTMMTEKEKSYYCCSSLDNHRDFTQIPLEHAHVSSQAGCKTNHHRRHYWSTAGCLICVCGRINSIKGGHGSMMALQIQGSAHTRIKTLSAMPSSVHVLVAKYPFHQSAHGRLRHVCRLRIHLAITNIDVR